MKIYRTRTETHRTAAVLPPPLPRRFSLEDRLEIDGLVADYAYRCDHDGYGSLPELFATDAVVSTGARQCRGADAITAWAQQTGQQSPRHTQHQVSNLRVVPAGPDAAEVTATFVVHAAVSGRRATHIASVAELSDRVVRTSAGWRIAEHRLVCLNDRDV